MWFQGSLESASRRWKIFYAVSHANLTVGAYHLWRSARYCNALAADGWLPKREIVPLVWGLLVPKTLLLKIATMQQLKKQSMRGEVATTAK